MRLALLSVAVLTLLGCDSRAEPAAPVVLATASWQVETAPRSTTGVLARRNLDGQIDGMTRALREERLGPAGAAKLVDLLLTRAEFFGEMNDYGRALAIADDAVAASPATGAIIAARGRARARLHLWEEALADYERAEAAGIPAAMLAHERASALRASGHSAEARRALAAAPRNAIVIARAMIAQDAGDTSEAAALHRQALATLRGTSPFPVAWTYAQLGRIEEARGRMSRARAYYQAALERLPGYVVPLKRLARLEAADGQLEQATALLRAAEPTADPDVRVLLAELLTSQGKVAEAKPIAATALAELRALAKRHPQAFIHHLEAAASGNSREHTHGTIVHSHP